jgi:uracil-DNA glycosylase
MENIHIRQNIKLIPSWLDRLKGEFKKDYMKNLKSFLNQEIKNKKIIYPKSVLCFAALNKTAFENVKVIIIGQDPYHGPGQAHGLCFSVLPNIPLPPSLKNIYKELHSDLGLPISKSGTLDHWADQGVLLLNAVLTVEDGQPGSHQGKGWEQFTDEIIRQLNQDREGLVFLLWGSYAQKKASFVDRKRHLVLQAPHPSPLSSHRGFFGSKPFSKINNWLISRGETPINW